MLWSTLLYYIIYTGACIRCLDIYTGQYSTKISIIYSKPHHICRIVCRIHLIRYITVVDITISYILVHVYVVRTYIQVNSTKISIIYSKPHHICRIVCRIHLIRYITVVDITISYILVHVYVVRTYIQVNSTKISIIYSKPHHTCRIVCRIHLIRYITVVDITISYILVHVYVVWTYIQVNMVTIQFKPILQTYPPFDTQSLGLNTTFAFDRRLVFFNL